MMRLPVQLANARFSFPPAELPDLSASGLDAATAADSVLRAHGDPALFASALAAGLAHDPAASRDRERTLDLVAIAAWRAGALGLRDDAVERLGTMDAGARRLAAAATLGFDVEHLADFRRRQQDDRFWWPGRAAERGYVLAAGGFRGLGGAWIRPPERAVLLADAGAFAMLVAGEWWRLDCDVWGARLTLTGEPPLAGDARDDGASIVVAPDTHLAWVHVRERA